MIHRKIIATIAFSLLFNNQSYSFSLTRVVQSAATTTVARPSRGLAIGYQVCQAYFWLPVALVAIGPLIGPWIVQMKSEPLTGNRKEFLEEICRNNGLDPQRMNLRLANPRGKSKGGSASGTSTIVMVPEETGEEFERALQHKKNDWAGIKRRRKKAEQEKIRSVKTFMTHEIGHIKNAHIYKKSLVNSLSFLATTYLFERYFLHQGYFKNWFEQPTTKKGLLCLIGCELLASEVRNIISNRLFTFPYSRKIEREADMYAITHRDSDEQIEPANSAENLLEKNAELEATANRFKSLHSKVTLPYRRKGRNRYSLGSFEERHFLDPLHPPLSERIAYFRAAARCLREKQRMPAQTKQS